MIMTDGFPGLPALVQQHGVTHARCVHHLSGSVLKLCKGRAIEDELWRVSRAPNFPKFVAEFKSLYKKNPSAAFFLCPPLAHHYARGEEATGQPDIVKKKVCEQKLEENNKLMPTMPEMTALAECYGIPVDDSTTPFRLYMHLVAVIQGEDAVLPLVVDSSSSTEREDDDKDGHADDEGIPFPIPICNTHFNSFNSIY